MFNAISWSDYFSAILFSLIIYYIVIGYRFYKEEILNLVGIKVLQPAKLSTHSVEDFKQSIALCKNEDGASSPDADIDFTPVILSFKDETSAYLQEAAANKVIKQEILYALQTIASKYAVLNVAECKGDVLNELFQDTDAQMPGVFKIDEFKTLFLSK